MKNGEENVILLRFNLPPIHILSLKFIPTLVDRLAERRKFFRKGDTDKNILRHLKFTTTYAAIGNKRVNSEIKSHVPVDFFI